LTTETADFPIVWDDPADAELVWHYDPVHMPDALAPLEFELGMERFLEGFGWGMIPKQFNYYTFFTISPERVTRPQAGKPTPDSIREGGRRWREEVLPEVLELTERYRAVDFASMTNEELIDEIDGLPEMRYHSGQLHTLAVTPGWTGVQFLIDTYKELTGGSELEATRLVQGHGDKSFEAGERLWQVAQVVAREPSVKDRLLTTDRNTALETFAALRSDPAAAEFIRAFDAYLEEFGWRSAASLGVTWSEDPTTALMLIRSHLQAEGYDPNAEQRRLAEEREAAIANAMTSLDDTGRDRLRDAIDAARSVVNLSEDHNYYIDQCLFSSPRRLILEAARRLGVLDDPDDVYFLRHAELTGGLRGETEGLAGTAARRKDELAYWKTVRPPMQIGKGAEGAPVAQQASRAPEPKGELSGLGASAGVATGPARVVLSLDEADRLAPGDILITKVTHPAWTPLFSIARAVVTEVGGILTHTAIAAREYGIPAVVALSDATRRIRDGQLIEVDGAAGTVRVIG
jgi:pyruvate,water dikinase